MAKWFLKVQLKKDLTDMGMQFMHMLQHATW